MEIGPQAALVGLTPTRRLSQGLRFQREHIVVNGKIRVGIIGVGGWAKYGHIPALQALDEFTSWQYPAARKRMLTRLQGSSFAKCPQQLKCGRFHWATRNGVSNITLTMARTLLPPYLTTSGGVKCCSACGQPFDAKALPSLGAAFRKHVEEVHRPSQDVSEASPNQFWPPEKP